MKIALVCFIFYPPELIAASKLHLKRSHITDHPLPTLQLQHWNSGAAMHVKNFRAFIQLRTKWEFLKQVPLVHQLQKKKEKKIEDVGIQVQSIWKPRWIISLNSHTTCTELSFSVTVVKVKPAKFISLFSQTKALCPCKPPSCAKVLLISPDAKTWGFKYLLLSGNNPWQNEHDNACFLEISSLV